ncbi:hypothetical protein M8542_39530 [Amycolatopsis sp. OK19-0408]|uniref:Uncharacterized protein n=1 Tax=Amycolatopsis iheyensis TaxID=2945988 RepID=A0A9X2NJD7_9PSEU|nr:hypothetical protein [Amycolatopsis iheyensis]MCR6488938.1 hypothetical protein [Amycolatopsis iheyensis]
MTATGLGKVQQVVLLCALAVCVVAMHHVGLASGMPGVAGVTATHDMSDAGSQAAVAPPDIGSAEHDPGMPGGMHDVLHLCLAVLCAAGALLLTVAAFLGISRFTTTFSCAKHLRGPPSRGRPTHRYGGRSILTSLCVLRT